MIDVDDINNILTGQLDSLRPLQPTAVKIFICANRNEFDEERKYLWHEVLPDLQQHCLQYGIDIVFIDMLLGNHSEIPSTTAELDDWLTEIAKCHRESIGPFFLGFVGSKYGDVPVPERIEKEELEHLISVAKKEKLKADHLGVWYELDENSIPPSYVLKTCAKSSRSSVYKDILETIQICSAKADTQGQGREEYFASGLERQIKQALWLNAANSMFVFKTTSKNLQTHTTRITDSPAKQRGRLTSVNDNDSKISKLKQKILEKTDEANVVRNETLTIGSVRDNKATGGDYMDSFITQIVQKLAQLIDMAIGKQKPLSNTSRDTFDFKDTLCHLQHCVDVSKGTSRIAYDQYISKIQAHLVNGSRAEHQLCIIKGPERCGKSCILTKASYRARELFGREAIVIPIFVGLTAKSLLAEDVFRTICWQMNIIFKQDVNVETLSMKQLSGHFHGLMQRISKSPRHVILLIDGIEKLQLYQKQNPNTQNFDAIDWLATKLPAKFHIIVTCSSTENSQIAERLESKLLQNEVIVYINSMSEDDCSMMLAQTLHRHRRKLTDVQESAVLQSFAIERNPVVVMYNSSKATQWTSKFVPVQTALPSSMECLMDDILTSVEAKVGVTIARYVCIYLVLARYGLTEAEMCDALTSNDEVVLTAHGNIRPDVIRFPCFMWTSILAILEPVLSRRLVGGKPLLTFINKRCVNAVRRWYLTCPEAALVAHGHLAAMFLEQWNNKDPFEPNKEYNVLTEEIDRLALPQPLVYNDSMYNKRKLHELWFHLLKSGDVGRFKEHTFCNFEYLLAMADADGIHSVMYNIDLVKSSLVDEDIHVLDMSLKSAGLALSTSPLQLASELIGRLRQIKDYFQTYIEPLVMQCMEWCDNYTLPLLVPLTTWMDNVHEPLITSMTHDAIIRSAALMPNGQHVILATDSSLSMYHLATRRHVKSFSGHDASIACVYLDPERRLLISGAVDRTICVWNIDTEVCINTFRDSKTYPTCLTCLDGSLVVCGNDDGSMVVRNMDEGRVIKTLTTHKARITAVKICKGNAILITSSRDGNLILWYTAEWSVMNTINVDELAPILCICVSVDSTFLVAGCDNGSLHVIAMATGTIAQTLKSHSGNITSVQICKDCHHCVAASSTGEIFLYNFRATEILDVFKGHNSNVMDVMVSENEQLAVSVSKDEVCSWSLLKRYSKETYSDTHSGTVSCLKLTSDAKKLVSGSLDGLIKTWNLDICDFADNFVGHTAPITCLDIANDNSFIVSGSSDMTLKVWNIIRVTVMINYKGHEQVVSGVHVLSDNRLVLSLDVSQKIHMWRAEDGQTMRLYAGPTTLHTVAPNNQFCISGAGDNKLQIWKLSDGSVIKEVSHSDQVTCLQCTSDSQFLVTGSVDCAVKVWELCTGKIVQIIVESSSPIRCLDVISDNETIVSGADDGVIQVCSLNLGSVERELSGHTDRVTCLQLTHDDSVLISGGLDNTVRVWNYRRGTQLTMFDAHYPIMGMVVTDTANRIGLQLENNNHVPILCLHNSPARPKQMYRSAPEVVLSVASIRGSSVHGTVVSSVNGSRADMSDFSSEEERTLPIKPRPSQRSRVPTTVIYQTKPSRRASSTSSIPQIIQYSPMKAPIQSTVQAQEKRRLKFPLPRVMNKPKLKSEDIDTKKSHVCCIV